MFKLKKILLLFFTLIVFCSVYSQSNDLSLQQQQFNAPPPKFTGQPPQFTPTQFGIPPPWNIPPQQWAQNAMSAPANDLMKFNLDPVLVAKANEWSEHKAPDGRSYYYHAGRAESVWEKPQPLVDLESKCFSSS